MALAPTSTARRARLAAAIVLICSLAACGSAVAPEDFVGGGSALTSGTVEGTAPGTVADVPGTVAPIDPAAPGAVPGDTTAPPSGSGTTGTPTDPGTATDVPGAGEAPAATDAPAPPAGAEGGSCDGFKNGPGITDDTITLATAADISGPIPNTFKSAFDGMNAYVAYFNASFPDGICGRKLALRTYDSSLSAAGSSEASEAACKDAFALVGSFSAFDSGGADITAKCGQPDIRTQAVEVARQKASTVFQVVGIDTSSFFLQPWVAAKQRDPGSIKNAAFVYLNAGASQTIAKEIIQGTTDKLGYNWKEIIVVDVTGVPNWNGYAAQLKAADVEFVQLNLADYTNRMAAAMKQANFTPVVNADGGAYKKSFLEGSAGEAMDGAYLFAQSALFEEANRVPELQLYLDWLGRVTSDEPAPTGSQAWAAGRLFTDLALQLGGKLSRPALISALKATRKFDANGIIPPGDVGARTTSPCVVVMQVQNGSFKRVTQGSYFECGPLS